MLAIDLTLDRGAFTLALSVELPLAGCTAVTGPSGSGKTTLLRLIAGFDTPTRGRIAFGDELLSDTGAGTAMPPHRRGFGYVFQEPRLFAHRRVRGNLTFSDRRSPSGASDVSFDTVVELCGLESLLERRTVDLSGGEQQRVSLARALLARPRLLLLDEPFSALDRPRRLELGALVRRLPAELGLPVVFVSHDLDEICRLADTVLVLTDGRVNACGPAEAVLNAAGLAAIDADPGAVLPGTVRAIDTRLQLVAVEAGGTTLQLPLGQGLAVGQPVRVRLCARDLAIALEAPERLSIRNVMAGAIAGIDDEPESAFATVRLAVDGNAVPARITRAAVEALGLQEGQSVFALVKSASLE